MATAKFGFKCPVCTMIVRRGFVIKKLKITGQWVCNRCANATVRSQGDPLAWNGISSQKPNTYRR